MRLPRLLHDIAIARGDGTYPKLLASFAKVDLIVLDDFGLAKHNSNNRRDMLELLEDRYATRSTLVTILLPIEKWHDWLGDPTFADAILDRLVHNAYKLKLIRRIDAKRRKLHRLKPVTDRHYRTPASLRSDR